MLRKVVVAALALALVALPLAERTVHAAALLTGDQPVSVPAPAEGPARPIVDHAPPDLVSPAIACTDVATPPVAPASARTGIAGAHAAFYARSGYPVLCPGSTGTVTVAFQNTGSLGWYGNASLGTWGPEPGQDKPTVVGGDGTAGSPATGWPAANRPATQPASYVGPGEVAWFQFAVKAPDVPGTYRLALRPLLEGQQWLEDPQLSIYVVVKADDEHVPSYPIALPVPPSPPPVARTYFPATLPDGSRQIRVPSLMYHYVSWLPPADPNMSLRMDLTVSPKDFEDQLRYLRDNGYNSITTKDLWWSLDQTAPLPQRPVMLTFDDGYADAYGVVLPLLQRYGFTGVFFITVNLVGRPGYITRDQVRALADAGMDVESHAMDHVSMAGRTLADQQYQMCRAREYLSAWTGQDVRHFAYPSGDYNAASFPALQSCGYLSAYKKGGGSIQSSNAIYLLQRARVRGQAGLGALLLALQQ